MPSEVELLVFAVVFLAGMIIGMAVALSLSRRRW